MNAGQRRIVRFALGAVPVFVAAACLYPFVLPAYQRAVFAAANALLSMLTPLSSIREILTGRWQILVHRAQGGRIVPYTLASDNLGLLAFFQLVIVSALLLATPVALRARIRLFVLGTALMWALHVVCVAGCVYGMALVDDPKRLVFKSLPIILGPFASGLAVVAWGALTWQHWLSPPEMATAPQRQGRRR